MGRGVAQLWRNRRTPLPVPPPQGGRGRCGTRLRNSNDVFASRLGPPREMMTSITSAQAAILAINSLALGGVLFLLSSGFSLIFGLMRIPNLMHGSFFMLGAYFGVTFLDRGMNFWL